MSFDSTEFHCLNMYFSILLLVEIDFFQFGSIRHRASMDTLVHVFGFKYLPRLCICPGLLDIL